MVKSPVWFQIVTPDQAGVVVPLAKRTILPPVLPSAIVVEEIPFVPVAWKTDHASAELPPHVQIATRAPSAVKSTAPAFK